MTTHRTKGSAVLSLNDEGIQDSLGSFERLLDPVDPIAVSRSFVRALARASVRPHALVPACARSLVRLATAWTDVAARTLGGDLDEPVLVGPKDIRFDDPAWSHNPLFRLLLETYLVAAQLLRDVVDAAEMDDPAAPKARFAANLFADALAPTNSLPTNPAALKECFDTAGGSVVQGIRNFASDLVENEGWPKQVDATPFVLGQNTAATPGRVVFKNELMEIIQYTPQTDEVYEIPLIICPPWINRFYIADLSPGKSLIEWAVQHGHSTFAISYRNPDASMRNVTFDDYVRLGPLTAIDVVRSIAGTDLVNTLAICLGGTLNTIMLAYLDRVGDHLVNVSTLLNSAIDYSDSGLLADLTADPATIRVMCRRMEEEGFLEADDMARTFTLLRANDLLFRPLVERWLLGRPAPAFDLLAWNENGTRIPGHAHARFAQAMYIDNALARGEMEVLGERLDVADVTTETYIVAAVEDHIVPWQSSYKSTQLLKGPVRFVLTAQGHIAGIVTPPSARARFWTNQALPADPLEWRERSERHDASWWEDWATWMDTRAGDRRPAPPLGSSTYRPTDDAPGLYVRS
jgi:polyhydroxyalkanoate synthase